MNFLEEAKQIARSFDPVTKNKIKNSAKIAIVGFIVGVLPLVQEDLLKILKDHPMAIVFITSFGSWLFNTLKEWLAGQPKA